MNSRFAQCYLDNLNNRLKLVQNLPKKGKVVKLDKNKKYEEKRKNKPS